MEKVINRYLEGFFIRISGMDEWEMGDGKWAGALLV